MNLKEAVYFTPFEEAVAELVEVISLPRAAKVELVSKIVTTTKRASDKKQLAIAIEIGNMREGFQTGQLRKFDVKEQIIKFAAESLKIETVTVKYALSDYLYKAEK